MYQKDWSKLGPVIGCFERDAASERAMLKRLDPKFRRIVQILRENGIETFESCQGGKGHHFPEPTVKFLGDYDAAYKAVSICINYRIPISCLRRYWDIIKNVLEGPAWEITLIGSFLLSATGHRSCIVSY